jgi:hypothetical protein
MWKRRKIRPDHLFQRNGSHQREGGRSRIPAPHPNHSRPVEIPDRRNPEPPLPPAPASLQLGAQPDPLGDLAARQREHVGIGRPCLRDGTNPLAQNSAFAATIVAPPRLARPSQPSGEIAAAITAISPPSTGSVRAASGAPSTVSAGASMYITLTTRR